MMRWVFLRKREKSLRLYDYVAPPNIGEPAKNAAAAIAPSMSPIMMNLLFMNYPTNSAIKSNVKLDKIWKNALIKK